MLIDSEDNRILWSRVLDYGGGPDWQMSFVEDGSRIRICGCSKEGKDCVLFCSVKDAAIEEVVLEDEIIQYSDENRSEFERAVYKNRFLYGDTVGYYKKTEKEIIVKTDDGLMDEVDKQHEICIVVNGKPEKLQMNIPMEDYDDLSGIWDIHVNDAMTYMVFFVSPRDTGSSVVGLYDLKNDSIAFLEEVPGREHRATDSAEVIVSDSVTALCYAEENTIFLYNNADGKLIGEVSDASAIQSFDIHEGALYTMWSDGCIRKYSTSDGSELKNSRFTDYMGSFSKPAWFYGDGIVIVSYQEGVGGYHSFVLDEESLERWDYLKNAEAYIPETDTFFIDTRFSDQPRGFFKRHDLDELIEMGYEQLGE